MQRRLDYIILHISLFLSFELLGEGGNQISAKSVADHLAAKINAKLNYTPSDEPAKPEEGGIFQKFEEELEINDFPQQAR